MINHGLTRLFYNINYRFSYFLLLKKGLNKIVIIDLMISENETIEFGKSFVSHNSYNKNTLLKKDY